MSLRSLLKLLPSAQRQVVKSSARRLGARAVDLAFSYTAPELEACFRRLGVSDGDAIVMQSAFRNLNGFQGEARHIIDCLLDIVGPRGHLFMMSMPYDGSAREWIDAGQPFDVRRTPSQMGLISESFRRRKGVVRSANPLHPVLAWGPRAEWVIEGHEQLEYSCGPGSPFEKMLSLGAKALLFDVDLHYMTFTHFLEDRFKDSAPVAVYDAEPLSAEIIDRAGQRRSVSVHAYNPEAMRRRNFAVLYDELRRRGLVRRERIGNTQLQLVPLQQVLDTTSDLVREGRHLFGAEGEAVRVAPSVSGAPSIGRMAGMRRAAEYARAIATRVSMPARRATRSLLLSSEARAQLARDSGGLPATDPGIDACVAAATSWIARAQDHTASGDAGVARHYSLLTGWSSSYPETTGYIVPTLLDQARRTNDPALRDRARRMLDWFVAIQLPEGGFQGGLIDWHTVKPVTFNTGQILIGLAAGVAEFNDPRYLDAMHRAARWLVRTQDADGCWRADPSPLVAAGEKTYDTHVAWGLFEAARLAPGCGYDMAAARNVRWAITHQRDNGWIGRCCLQESTQPLTHTIGYALRGFVEAYRFTREPEFLAAARRTADPLIKALGADGHLPGRLRSDWSPEVSWACLTGTAQISACWLLLHDETRDAKYLDAARRANAYVRRTMQLEGSDGVRGGVKGSFPVNGGYGTFEMLAWAAKFTIDANVMERDRALRVASLESPALSTSAASVAAAG